MGTPLSFRALRLSSPVTLSESPHKKRVYSHYFFLMLSPRNDPSHKMRVYGHYLSGIYRSHPLVACIVPPFTLDSVTGTCLIPICGHYVPALDVCMARCLVYSPTR